MILEAPQYEVEDLKKTLEGEIEGLNDYISMLNGVIETGELDIRATREKADTFQLFGLMENYGYLKERIHETQQRILTCRKCVQDCIAQVKHKEERLHLLVLF